MGVAGALDSDFIHSLYHDRTPCAEGVVQSNPPGARLMASETDRIRSLLKKLAPSLPRRPKIRDIRFELGADEAGDPAVFVTVLLDDSTRDEDWIAPKLDPIAQRIRDELHKEGAGRWPYVRFARPSDLKRAG